ncbi:hypothetical protein AMATHDRAFT_47443 [Amanita thiersii Skay4041]|uniref:assimilatory sulfite reductase (NADPH) n=1 Tax=Amanita thiersii Skay4041 TaxID=703135 RepID=A0A2A9NTR7_9AGAR|nr:hypothetical protein AMATHDRAFT_47443 [Amanita thiersii Skay4041]
MSTVNPLLLTLILLGLNAIARIAYLASDVLINSEPYSPTLSSFSQTFQTLSNSSQSQPKVLDLPSNTDCGPSIIRHSNVGLVTLTASVNSQLVTRLILQSSELSCRPVLLHLALATDLSEVLPLRSAFPYFLLSTSAQEAYDNALLASRLTRLWHQAVVHVFYPYDGSEDIEQIEDDKILSFLLSPEHHATPKGCTTSQKNGIHQNGHDKLSTNGHMNGRMNKYVNGHSNGHSNGRINGHASGRLDHPKYEDHITRADDAELSTAFRAYELVSFDTLALTRRPSRALSYKGTSHPHTVIVVLGRLNHTAEVLGDISIVTVSLLNPLLPSRLLAAIPSSTNRVVVVEHIHKWNTKWLPLYLDVVSALQHRDAKSRPIVQSAILDPCLTIPEILQSVSKSLTQQRTALESDLDSPRIPHYESSYTKMLDHLFSDRFEISNSPSLIATLGEVATSPEFALGRIRGQVEQRHELVQAVKELLQGEQQNADFHRLLSQWLISKDDPTKSRTIGREIVSRLESGHSRHASISRILSLRGHFPSVSRWIIGSDAWSYDLGASGLHHVIASGLNVNILIIDSTPYTKRNLADPHRRKQDIGLYAMNYGNVYVASVAIFSSHAQVLQAMTEADRYNGPSVVLAYLPYQSEDCPALQVLQETKLAVDTGYWPLYRWDPSKELDGGEPFSLDSDSVKNELKLFLDRQNHLSQLVRSRPEIATDLVSSLGENIKEARQKRSEQSYSELLTALDAPPLLVLYASDGGNAEKVAKRLANRASFRGLTTMLATLDSISLDSLVNEEYVAFVTSTAGQGEPPQNGRQFFKAVNAATAHDTQPLAKLKYSVFGMGDSHYWPRPEDAHYYNKPGKDLDFRLEKLGGERFAALGLGDDQDADGYQTGYKLWEASLWKALGVDSIEVTEPEPEPITNEHIKAASGYLRGTIVEGLQDMTTGALAASDTQLTKFHGIYQQDDRDIRDERQVQGVEPAYSFMIRVRMPGGVCKSDQWLKMDQIADEHGNGTFKITTRQTFQFHGVIKRHLKPAIQDINRVLLDTLAACGDVNRNVICSSIPTMSKLHAQVYEFAKAISNHLIPRTTAYHEIWLDKHKVAGDAVQDFEPLYGEFYLPRKFKIAVAVPPTNDVDVFANDLGFIAIVGDDGNLAGFNVTVGGGMGVTHGNKKTYPRAADIIGFCTPEQGKFVAEKVMLVQRDNGNRTEYGFTLFKNLFIADRTFLSVASIIQNARLKYTIDRMGLDAYKAEVEKLLGYSLQPAHSYTFDRNIDDFGWHQSEDGKHHFMLFIENGRIQDEPGHDFKSGLREIAKVHKGTFRLTTNQHLMVSDIAEQDLPRIKALLNKYKLDNLEYSGLRLSSSACVAFPTCGLAMAESERYLPLLIDKVEKICEEHGLRNDSIVMRMTGCPNGCARPYLAEVAFVGKAPGSYSMLLGGGYYGQRLNKIYRETVTEPEILAILRPMIKQYSLERYEEERFGDWTIRAGYISPTTSGKKWYEGMGGKGEHREITMTV